MENKSVWQVPLCLSPLVAAALVPGAGAYFGFLIVIISLIAIKVPRGPTLAFIDGSLGRSVGLGVLGGFALAVAGFVVAFAMESGFGLKIDNSAFDSVRGNLPAYLTVLAIGIGVGGILEELTFRGFVIGWGTALFGERAKVWLVLASAAIFGFSHLYQGLAGMIATGVIGALLGFMYLYCNRKLLPVIIAHSVSNIIGITMLYLGVY